MTVEHGTLNSTMQSVESVAQNNDGVGVEAMQNRWDSIYRNPNSTREESHSLAREPSDPQTDYTRLIALERATLLISASVDVPGAMAAAHKVRKAIETAQFGPRVTTQMEYLRYETWQSSKVRHSQSRDNPDSPRYQCTRDGMTTVPRATLRPVNVPPHLRVNPLDRSDDFPGVEFLLYWDLGASESANKHKRAGGRVSLGYSGAMVYSHPARLGTVDQDAALNAVVEGVGVFFRRRKLRIQLDARPKDIPSSKMHRSPLGTTGRKHRNWRLGQLKGNDERIDTKSVRTDGSFSSASSIGGYEKKNQITK